MPATGGKKKEEKKGEGKDPQGPGEVDFPTSTPTAAV